MLVDVVAIPPTGSPFFRFVQEHPGLLAKLPAYIHGAIVTAYVRGASHRGAARRGPRRARGAVAHRRRAGRLYRQIEQFDDRYLEEFQGRLAEIDIPVRIMWGSEDAWIAPAVGRRLSRLIPTAGLRLAGGAGHLVHHDAPAALADELRAWLAAQAP